MRVEGLGWYVFAAASGARRCGARASLWNAIGAGEVVLGVLAPARAADARLARVVEAGGRGVDDARGDASGPREIARLAERSDALVDGRRNREEDLRRRATHDGLTGLPNRAGLGDLWR